MRTQIGLLSVVGFFGLLAAADAQSLSALPAGTAFDGTYRFVSSTKVNAMYTSPNGSMLLCPDRIPGPLTIAQGQARYTTASGNRLEGTVGPQGELEMRVMEVGGSRPMELRTSAEQIDATGTVRARQVGGACSYDFVWQKQTT
jgi:hypothetical protein